METAGSCELSNEPSGSIKYMVFLHYLSDHQLLKNIFADIVSSGMIRIWYCMLNIVSKGVSSELCNCVLL
jgi:hypothetical protein